MVARPHTWKLSTKLSLMCLVATVASIIVPHANAARSSSVSMDSLTRSERSLAFRLADMERRKLFVNDRLDTAAATRDKALDRLMQRLVDRYKTHDQQSLIVTALSGYNVDDALNRVQVHQRFTEYEQQLVAELDNASDQALLDQQQSEDIGASIADLSAQLDSVRDEIRLQLAAQALARTERARRRAERKAKADARAQLISSSSRASLMIGSFAPGEPPAVPASEIDATSIDAYLFSKQSSMAGSGAYVVMSARTWNLDPRLIIAIAGAESNFGEQVCGSYNAWGWSCPNSPVQFSSWQEGIETIASGLRRYYIDSGRTSVSAIQQKWAPSGAANDPTGLNNHWVGNVTKFLIEMGGSPTTLIATA